MLVAALLFFMQPKTSLQDCVHL